MRFSTALILTGLFAAVNAHFQLQFPPPRGVFVEDQEPNFCDGYDSVASNRTSFPLSGGIISLNSEHPQWTAAVFITNASNPTSFDNFTQITSFFQETIEGTFCMSFDLSQTNATGLTNGENVTIQVKNLCTFKIENISSSLFWIDSIRRRRWEFVPGKFDECFFTRPKTDRQISQCADLTLDTSANVSSQSCTNTTSSSSGALVGVSLPTTGSMLGLAAGLAGLAFAFW
ncbi:hypothetical protein F5879DRAFT_986142 [Lentinula edodes]|nr:hypothetical protein F5879DRAFT_986142 [Lentinula edodes]